MIKFLFHFGEGSEIWKQSGMHRLNVIKIKEFLTHSPSGWTISEILIPPRWLIILLTYISLYGK